MSTEVVSKNGEESEPTSTASDDVEDDLDEAQLRWTNLSSSAKKSEITKVKIEDGRRLIAWNKCIFLVIHYYVRTEDVLHIKSMSFWNIGTKLTSNQDGFSKSMMIHTVGYIVEIYSTATVMRKKWDVCSLRINLRKIDTRKRRKLFFCRNYSLSK